MEWELPAAASPAARGKRRRGTWLVLLRGKSSWNEQWSDIIIIMWNKKSAFTIGKFSNFDLIRFDYVSFVPLLSSFAAAAADWLFEEIFFSTVCRLLSL